MPWRSRVDCFLDIAPGTPTLARGESTGTLGHWNAGPLAVATAPCIEQPDLDLGLDRLN